VVDAAVADQKTFAEDEVADQIVDEARTVEAEALPMAHVLFLL